MTIEVTQCVFHFCDVEAHSRACSHPIATNEPGRHAADSGSATVEMVLLAPLLMVLMLFVVFLGRATGAVEQVRHAADEAARAASQVSRPNMEAVATDVARADLISNGVNCTSTSVAVAISNAQPVSSVTVTVSCAVNGDGLALLRAHERTVSASSNEVIDVHRAG